MTEYETVIIGAGFSGIAMAIRLLEAGRGSLLMCERAARPGGTWRDNSYPGAACDVPSHLYSLSFEPNPGWTRLYGAQAEILDYIDTIVERRSLADHIRFNCCVTEVAWDAGEAVWRIALDRGETLRAQFVVAAWGQLNRPQIPRVAGAETFAGSAFHSARWRHDVDLHGRRVAVVGSAASAVQIVPEVAKVAGHLTVFQRTPNWIVPRLDRPYAPDQLDGFHRKPELLQASRDDLHREREERFSRIRPGSEKAREFSRIATDHLETQDGNPDLRRRLTPEYPIGCKRVLVSDDYYPALLRANVSLVTDGIERLEPTGVRTRDGCLHEVDVLVYATGFAALASQGDVDVVGRDGTTLEQAWSAGPEAYLGISVTDFPGLFFLYGPNTNLGHNSVLQMIEIQIEYVVQAVLYSVDKGPGAPEVRAEVMSAYNQDLQRRFADTAWAGSCASWYKIGGRITNNWVGDVGEYRTVAGAFDGSAFAFVQPQPA